MKWLLRSRRTIALVGLSLVLVLALGGATALAKRPGGGRGNTVVAQGPFATVTLKVIDYYGSVALAGVRVDLYNDATGYRGTAATDASGCATFEGVPYFDTNYRAYLVLKGYRDSVRIVTVDASEVFSQHLLYPNSVW